MQYPSDTDYGVSPILCLETESQQQRTLMRQRRKHIYVVVRDGILRVSTSNIHLRNNLLLSKYLLVLETKCRTHNAPLLWLLEHRELKTSLRWLGKEFRRLDNFLKCYGITYGAILLCGGYKMNLEVSILLCDC